MHSSSGGFLTKNGPVEKSGLSGGSELLMGVPCTSACLKQTWERISSVACSLRMAMEAFMAILKEGLGADGGSSDSLRDAKTVSPATWRKKKHVDSYTAGSHHNPRVPEITMQNDKPEVSRNDLLPCLATLGLYHTGAEAGGWNINKIYQKKKKAYEQNGKLNFL